MAIQHLLLLRGRAYDGGNYGSTRSRPRKRVPPRTPSLHAKDLFAQLDALEEKARSRPGGARDEVASREVVAIAPAPGFPLEAGALGSKTGRVEVIGTDTASGLVLLDAPGPALPHLRRKVEEYADDTKAKKFRAHEGAIAPIESISLATLDTLGVGGLRGPDGERKALRWVEIGCRGGKHRPLGESASSQHQVHHQLRRLGAIGPADALRSFVAAERIYFFARTSIDVLERLIDAVDCIFEVEYVPRELLTWLTSLVVSVTAPDIYAPIASALQAQAGMAEIVIT